jgi:hypothetical protein
MAQNSLLILTDAKQTTRSPRPSLSTYDFPASVVITDQVRSLSQALDNEFMTFCPTVDILDIICGGLKVAGCVVALGDEDIVVHTALKWLIQWDWGTLRMSADLEDERALRAYHELLFNLTEALEAGRQLEMVVCSRLGNCGDDGNVVALRADTVGA